MPKQVLPSQEQFSQFAENLKDLGFRKITRRESQITHRRLKPITPRPSPGREVGFSYSANDLTVIVWTTFLEEEGHARDTDAGHVLIKDGDKVPYYSRPRHRTKNYLRNLTLDAIMAQERIVNRPLCRCCGAYLHIVRGEGLRARYWRCADETHKSSVSWNHGLSKENLAIVKRVDKIRRRYRKIRRAQGKKPGSAMLKRRTWNVGNPQNKI